MYDVALADLAAALGALAIGWTVAVAFAYRSLLPAPSARYGLLAGAIGASGLCLTLGASAVRRYHGLLELGWALLGAGSLLLLVFGAIEGRVGAIAAGAALLAASAAAAWLGARASSAGYRPRWFGARSFRTMTATVETILDADGREAIPPQRAAMHTDLLLASIEAPVQPQIKQLFFALEWIMPLLVGRPVPFSMLGGDSRRRVLEALIGRPGDAKPGVVGRLFKTAARTLKVLSCAGYYGDARVMRSIGFEEFEQAWGKNADRTPFHYADPFRRPAGCPPGARNAHANGAAAARARAPRPKPDAEERYDAVIIGSGASGSVMAYQLARKGLSVAVLERGRREDPQTFEHSELSMFARLYKDGGLQTAADRNTAIFQGATVGGSTVINNAIWLRPDLDRVLKEWRAAGAPIDRQRLEAAYAELECALHVTPVDRRVANPGTDVFLDGAERAKIPAGLLENNRDTCLGCGWCNYGCRYNRKTSMLVTFIPWAEERGVVVYDQVQDARIRLEDGRRAVGVKAKRAGRDCMFLAEKVIVCAGAIGSSAVLLASGIHAGGRVGKGLHVLGGIFLTGDMGEPVDGFRGIGLTSMAKEAREYVMESYFAPPLAFSVRLGGWLLSHFERAQRYTHFIDGGVMVGTDPCGGEVTLASDGSASIKLTPTARDIEHLREGIKEMAGIYFAAGARRVYPSTFRYIDLMRSNYGAVVDREIHSVEDVLFGSAHPQGGNAMCEDAREGVVGRNFAVHGYEGLWGADTSVWPSNIRANCQATAMAMAHYAADEIQP